MGVHGGSKGLDRLASDGRIGLELDGADLRGKVLVAGGLVGLRLEEDLDRLSVSLLEYLVAEFGLQHRLLEGHHPGFVVDLILDLLGERLRQRLAIQLNACLRERGPSTVDAGVDLMDLASRLLAMGGLELAGQPRAVWILTVQVLRA